MHACLSSVKCQLYSAISAIIIADVHDMMYSQSITMTHPVGVADLHTACAVLLSIAIVLISYNTRIAASRVIHRVYSSVRLAVIYQYATYHNVHFKCHTAILLL
jgi:hypothetical protein